MLELISDPQLWIAFLTLTALELVLGIDMSFSFQSSLTNSRRSVVT